jgi:hypothetical protein
MIATSSPAGKSWSNSHSLEASDPIASLGDHGRSARALRNHLRKRAPLSEPGAGRSSHNRIRVEWPDSEPSRHFGTADAPGAPGSPPTCAGTGRGAPAALLPQDSGLHDRRGEFACVGAQPPPTLSWRHGPIRVSASRHHLIHADGEPFFWLGDTAWNGPSEVG